MTVAFEVAHYTSPYDAPFFTGSPSATDLVPGIYHVAIDGHPYLVDLDHDDVGTIQAWMREETQPLLRPQSDQSTELGEQSLSPDVAWRVSQSTWHKGAGQDHFDRATSDKDRARFRSSKGLDPWTMWELGLLEDTNLVDAFAGGSGSSLVTVNPAGTARAYASSGGNNLRTAPDPLSAWAAVTGIPGTNCSSLCTDGVRVYQAWGTSGIYVTDAPATTAAQGATGTVTKLAYVKGRLLAANGAALYEPTINTGAPPALPTAFFTHPSANWLWAGFAEGDEFIYAAGNVGAQGNVYKIPIEKETTNLGKPISALTGGLPPGETIYSIHGALGFIFIGTNRGVRFCVPTQTGDLNVGALIPTGGPVRCFTTWDRFTYFGWSNYDASSSGLGRLDPSVVTDALVPAYASDVMASVTGTVNAVAILPGLDTHGHPVFTIDGSGVWRCVEDKPVASGELRTGLISYGLVDSKVAAFLDFRHLPLPAGTSISAQLIADEDAGTSIGTSNATGSVGPGPLTGAGRRGELFELVFTLNGKTTVTYAQPTLRRWTLRSIPAPARPSTWTLPLIFTYRLASGHDVELPFDPLAELSFLRSLRDTQRPVTFQWGQEAFTVVVSEITYLIDGNTGVEAVPAHNWTGLLGVVLNQVIG